MIVREHNGSFVLIDQHDHGRISGEFAKYWGERPRPLDPTLYAISNHDIGWQKLDETVRWNGETGKPYSFTSFPMEPKLRAYTEGLDYLEACSPYAACLCSMHYGSFVQNSTDVSESRFREDEARRRRRLENAMSGEELENLERNFRLLQLCDDLSLFVCLNEPGRNDHPWYRDGFRSAGAGFEPVWEDRRTLRLVPNPFSDPFELVIPYWTIGRDGREMGSGRLELRVVR